MRIQVEYDEYGTITAIAAPRDAPGALAHIALRPQEGRRVTFVEAREVNSDQDLEALRALRDTHRVEIIDGLGRLVPHRSEQG
jgi:hypothetical protein